jgi:hypothetical protein
MTVGVRKPGEFCWINMLSPEPAKACEFFSKLFGWTYFDMSGMGYGIKVGGKDIGGLFDLNGPNTPPGTPPVIGVLIKVENAQQTADRVNALGGKAMPPFDVMQNGRLAVCFDPNGAQFDVWESKTAPMTEVDSMTHGAPSWSETITTDVAKATKFYCDLFNWTSDTKSMPGFQYTMFKLGQEYVAGMMPLMPDMGPMPPHWGTYFTVDDVDASARIAEAAGGRITMPLMNVPDTGRMVGIASPQGVHFYMITYLSR